MRALQGRRLQALRANRGPSPSLSSLTHLLSEGLSGGRLRTLLRSAKGVRSPTKATILTKGRAQGVPARSSRCMHVAFLHTSSPTMVRPLSLAQHTLYADLLDQGIDDLFDPEMPENGSILVRSNRAGAPADHAYYQGYRPAAGDAGRGQRYARYLGRADDPDVVARIARFQRVKTVRAERATTVSALIGAGLPRPDWITGRIIEALARAGLFPDHAVLLGEAAFQTYDGVLGVRFPKRPQRTRDDPAVEIALRDPGRVGSILDALRTMDPSFASGPEDLGLCRSATGVQVAVVGLDQANDETSDLTGFLIDNPVQSLVLHGPGIPVAVPAPERHAVHALTEARRGAGACVNRVCTERARHLVEALRAIGRDPAPTAAILEAATRNGS